MGGPATCTAMIPGSTPEEMVDNAMKHVEASHPDLAAQVKGMSKEDKEKWMADFRTKFAALPEMPAA